MQRRSPRLATDGGHPGAPLFRALDQPVAAYAVDPEPTVRAVNPAFEERNGGETVEPGTSLRTALSAIGVEPSVANAVDQAAADGVTSEEMSDVEGDDEAVSVSVLPEPSGGTDGVDRDGYAVVRTVSTDAVRADRLATFARVVSHDLRNPLDVARIRLDAAEETGEPVHFEKVRDAHDRIEHIATDVLLLTDPAASVDATPVDLATVVDAAWETVDTGEATLEVDGLGRIEADADHLQRLFENLFRNAVEHGSPKAHSDGDGASDTGTGAVTVTVGTCEDGFYVADDGPGISAAVRNRLFEPGESENGGSGLGLAVVRHVATAHGWTVCPGESAAGGARFTVTGVDVVGDSD